MKKVIFVLFTITALCLPVNTGCAINAGIDIQRLARNSGSVCGWGSSKSAAYADAARKVPSGAKIGSATYTGENNHYTCWLKWYK